jgi:hypothetical protein
MSVVVKIAVLLLLASPSFINDLPTFVTIPHQPAPYIHTTQAISIIITNLSLNTVPHLQQTALYEICQLNLLRQKVMEMEVELCALNLEVLQDVYVKQDICQLSQNFKLCSKARIHFPTKEVHP